MTAMTADVLVCGASFAGLAVARELAGAGADVLVVDRYEIGARATSACAAPTPWLHAMGVAGAIRRELLAMTFTTPHGTVRYRLPWSWSAFDYRELCALLWAQCGGACF
jgi:digeranylgeranylglycerophospholipid reductase